MEEAGLVILAAQTDSNEFGQEISRKEVGALAPAIYYQLRQSLAKDFVSPLLGKAPSIAQRNATIHETNLLIHAADASFWSADRTAIFDKDRATAQDMYIQLRESLMKGLRCVA